jgi:hypothetical protein
MQCNRLSAKFIVISLLDDEDYKNSFGILSNSENLLTLAKHTRGYYLEYKDLKKFSKYDYESEPKMKHNKLTPLQKMLFSKPLNYE